jgi:hypothetical protein
MQMKPVKPVPTLLKPTELVERIKEKKPKILGTVPEKKAIVLIQMALAELGRHIAAAEVGVVRVPGMGRFQSRMVEREKDGKKVNLKRIVFMVAKPKSKK